MFSRPLVTTVTANSVASPCGQTCEVIRHRCFECILLEPSTRESPAGVRLTPPVVETPRERQRFQRNGRGYLMAVGLTRKRQGQTPELYRGHRQASRGQPPRRQECSVDPEALGQEMPWSGPEARPVRHFQNGVCRTPRSRARHPPPFEISFRLRLRTARNPYLARAGRALARPLALDVCPPVYSFPSQRCLSQSPLGPPHKATCEALAGRVRKGTPKLTTRSRPEAEVDRRLTRSTTVLPVPVIPIGGRGEV